MKKDRFKFNATVNFIIEKEGQVLLMKRSDGFFKGGYWVMPAGHMDGNETASCAARRELKEELDIEVKPEDLEFAHVVHSITPYLERIDFFFKIKNFSGEINNLEHDKCDEIRFFAYDNLPSPDKMDKTTVKVINGLKQGRFYSEKGFDQGYKGFSELDKFTFDTLYNAIEIMSAAKKVNFDEIAEAFHCLEQNKTDNFKDLLGNLLKELFIYAAQQGVDVKEVIYDKFKKG